MTNRQPALDWQDIIAQHNSLEFLDEFCDDCDPSFDCIPDTIEWYTTGDLVAMVGLIDAELQRRADTAQVKREGFYQDDDEALWEGEGGARRGYSDGDD